MGFIKLDNQLLTKSESIELFLALSVICWPPSCLKDRPQPMVVPRGR